MLCPAPYLSAQNTDTGTPIIRVYANLLQIPVLVLDQFQRPVQPIDPAKFTIQFDNGTPVRPKVVRSEGEDPITLAVLVDTSHRNRLLPHLADALANLAPGKLGHADRIVVYGADGCQLRRYGLLLPVQRGLVQANISFAVDYRRPEGAAGACTGTMGLWRSMAAVADLMKDEPGRRILLVVTNGIDTSRSFRSATTHEFATNSGVAIFSIAERGKVPPDPDSTNTVSIPMSSRGSGSTTVPVAIHGATELATVSEASGGLLLQTDPRGLDATLERFVAMVRGRYIVEFTRPPGLSSGRHVLTVSCGQPQYFLRAAGTSLPTADPHNQIRTSSTARRPPYLQIRSCSRRKPRLANSNAAAQATAQRQPPRP